MKQFFKFTLAAMLGFILAQVVLFFVSVLIIMATLAASFEDFSGKDKMVDVDEGTVLHLKLDDPIVDRANEKNFDIDLGFFRVIPSLGLNHLLEDIEKAKTDDRIKGIYLEVPSTQFGYATATELRNALKDFKESGKWIVSYTEVMNQKSYFLSSVADEVYLYPEGEMLITGLNAEVTFLTGTLDKLGIEAQIIRGSNNKFKAAVEPLFRKDMSEANKEQTRAFLDGMWQHLLNNVSEARGISVDKLQQVADNFEIRSAGDAVELGLLNDLMYPDEIEKLLKGKAGTEEDEDLELLTFQKYHRAEPFKSDEEEESDEDLEFDLDQPRIAVVYASGDIVTGEGERETIGSVKFAETFEEVREDSTIKAVVLRINSPGGSALASDVIWREVSLTREKKPVVVSMGDLCASGGYYIASAADKIYANPNTLTGSIGVFGVIPNMQEFYNDKIGLTFDGVKTAEHANFADISRPLTQMEKQILQNFVDETYNTFLQRVSEGRDMAVEQVDSMGQGRVWIGNDALELGLVDEIGGLQAAIDGTAEMLDIDEYKVSDYPKRKDPFQEILDEMGQGAKNSITSQLLSPQEAKILNTYREASDIGRFSGIQMRLPAVFDVE